jgi:hypothetical protein
VTDGSTFQVSYVLDDVIEILKAGRSDKLFASRPIRAEIIDDFLFSGRFNSVLGLDGFRIFKAELSDAVSRLDDEPIALARMLETLLHSGVHYVAEHRPSGLPALEANARRPPAFRRVARGCAHLAWADFAVLAERFKQTRGRCAHVEPGDSAALRALQVESDLFDAIGSAKAALLQMGHRELRAICRTRGIAAARSIEATADRLVSHCDGDLAEHLPAGTNGGYSLVARDPELATGDDIVRLDAYLRAVATRLGDDLVDFVTARRHAPWLRRPDAS